MTGKRIILDNNQVSVTIDRLCRELLENHGDFSKTVLVGIQPRGKLLCQRITQRLMSILDCKKLKFASLDISFYRDDFRRRETPIEAQAIEMHSIESKNVVLIDDVLYTGRSVRSAIDALMAFGRPRNVELLCLIDRRFSRQFQIKANYIGKTVDSIDSEKIIVEWKEIKKRDQVILIKSKKNE